MDDKYFYRVGVQDGVKKAIGVYVTSFYIVFFLAGVACLLIPSENIKYGVVILIAFLFTFVIPPCSLTRVGD